MLNDLLMLTKFNRNAESERASGRARSGAFRRGEELGFECDVGRRGVRSEGARARAGGARREERPFDAKTRWRILKNNTRLILPRSLGPSAILHSQGGEGGEGGEGGGLFPSLPSILLSSPLLSSLLPPAVRRLFLAEFWGPEKQQDKRAKGEARREGGREETR